MITSMERIVKTYAAKGFDIPEDEMKVLRKWYLKGAIEFKKGGKKLQRDLYGPCLELEEWEGVYYMTWLRVFKSLCEKHNVKVGITKYSIAEYCSNPKYRIYPVVSTKKVDYDESLEKELLSQIGEYDETK